MEIVIRDWNQHMCLKECKHTVNVLLEQICFIYDKPSYPASLLFCHPSSLSLRPRFLPNALKVSIQEHIYSVRACVLWADGTKQLAWNSEREYLLTNNPLMLQMGNVIKHPDPHRNQTGLETLGDAIITFAVRAGSVRTILIESNHVKYSISH